jgi:hypothetical protein
MMLVTPAAALQTVLRRLFGDFPVGILYNFGDTGGTNVENFYQ